MAWAEDQGADVLVLPELTLTGYPLDDLVTHAGFLADADAALARGARVLVHHVGGAVRGKGGREGEDRRAGRGRDVEAVEKDGANGVLMVGPRAFAGDAIEEAAE